MNRIEFSVATRKAAWERCAGFCEECRIFIEKGQGPEYDHRVEAVLGGEATLKNCLVLCIPCHRAKTRERAPVLAKTARTERKSAGLTARKAVIPGSKASGWKRRVDGTVVRRE
jgi:5-methylcytosine-specific restriction endonuclease McrA